MQPSRHCHLCDHKENGQAEPWPHPWHRRQPASCLLQSRRSAGRDAVCALDIFERNGTPGFNQDDEHNPPAKVVELKRRIREADAILLVTPEDNSSMPGVLKNAAGGDDRPYCRAV